MTKQLTITIPSLYDLDDYSGVRAAAKVLEKAGMDNLAAALVEALPDPEPTVAGTKVRATRANGSTHEYVSIVTRDVARAEFRWLRTASSNGDAPSGYLMRWRSILEHAEKVEVL